MISSSSSDADSDVLADYVLALIRSDAPDDEIRNTSVENLEDFLRERTCHISIALAPLKSLTPFQTLSPLSKTSSQPLAPSRLPLLDRSLRSSLSTRMPHPNRKFQSMSPRALETIPPPTGNGRSERDSRASRSATTVRCRTAR